MENILTKSYGNSGNEPVLQQIAGNTEVLDIGCGAGDNAGILKARGCQVDGISISETELREAGSSLRSGYLYNLENGLPPEVTQKKYDFVICSHVLEHICYPEKLLKDALSCLKPAGRLVVALPNLMHYHSRWQLLMGNFDYRPIGIWDNTHFRWYTYKTGALLLEKNGFKVIYKTVNGLLPGASFFSKILNNRVSAKLYDQLKQFMPGLIGYQLFYVAEAAS
jgi:SAM-dependent methyltransferase